MFSSMTPNPTPISRDYNKKLVKIIQALLVYEQSNIFRKPITHKSLAWDDYKDIVKRPIDLNFVRRQYNEGKYKSVEEVLDDIQLVWDNVFLYGKRQHQSYDMAIKMQKYYDDLLNDLVPEYHEKINRVLYFKQFQNKKPQKKVSSQSNSDKNSKKVEKMEVQNIKEEIKVEKQPQVIVQNKRRQPASTRRQLYALQTYLTPTVVSQISQVVKKVPEVQSRQTQTRRSANIINRIEQQQPIEPIKQPYQLLKPSQTDDVKQIAKQTPYPASKNQPLQVQPSSIQSELSQPLPLQSLEPFEAQESQDNQFPPILVNLSKTPSFEEVAEITQMMRMLFQLQEMEILSKIVKLLTKYEKENMIIDGDQVNFRMNEIHTSTYSRIRKQIQLKIHQLEQTDKVKDIQQLKEKFNVKLMNGFHTNVVQNNLHSSSHQDSQQN